MKLLSLTNRNEKQVVETAILVLNRGGIVIAPTDTVYGLLADASNEQAVDALIRFKARPLGKPISVFVSDFRMLNTVVDRRSVHEKLLSELLPGPFTVILPALHKTSSRLESEKGTLGVRIPENSFIVSLVSSFGKPVTATSANISGKAPHHSIETLLRQFPESKKTLIDLVVDDGTLPRNKPSTVVDLVQKKIKIIRKGDIVFSGRNTFLSESPRQTRKIARHLMKKILAKKQAKPIIFILEGELGVGKTVFVKGLGEFFGINDIVSPSYVISYEYKSNYPPIQCFVHLDLYNVEEEEELNHLGLDDYLNKRAVLCFEWGEKAGGILKKLRQKGKIVYIEMKYVNQTKREIGIRK